MAVRLKSTDRVLPSVPWPATASGNCPLPPKSVEPFTQFTSSLHSARLYHISPPPVTSVRCVVILDIPNCHHLGCTCITPACTCKGCLYVNNPPRRSCVIAKHKPLSCKLPPPSHPPTHLHLVYMIKGRVLKNIFKSWHQSLWKWAVAP